jgi:multidrug efflux pump subunit AcrA (membrane-fusion protein)
LLKLAEADLKLQHRELVRLESLMRQQATSQASLDTAQRAQIQAENAALALTNDQRVLTTRRGRFLSDKERLLVQLEQAMLNRQRCEITAPMDGMITSDAVEQDDFVQPGTLLAQLEDTRQVEVRFDLRLDQLRWVWQGTPQALDPLVAGGSSYRLPALLVQVSVDVDGYTWLWDATLMRYDGAGLNPATRTVPCIALVKDPRAGRWDASRPVPPTLPGPPALLRGMFVTVHIDVPSSQPLLQVPLVALRPGNQVWVVRDDHLYTVDVKVAQAAGERLLLFAGLSDVTANDQLVVSPLAMAIDGMQVRTQATTRTVAEMSSKRPADGGISGSSTTRSKRELSR